MLFTVFDQLGEPFEVRPDHARKLVVEQGWSMEPVSPAPASGDSESPPDHPDTSPE